MLKFILSLKTIVIFGLIGGVMLWVWNQKRLERTNEAPTVYPSIDAVDVSDTKWIKIDSCTLNLFASAYDVSEGKNLKEIFIPISYQSEEEYFFLHSKDTSHLRFVKERMEWTFTLNALKNNIEFAQEDPAYLEFKGETLAEMQAQLDSTSTEYLHFIQKNRIVQTAIEGILNPNGALTDDVKNALAKKGTVYIIREGKPVKRGFYYWFLLFMGSIFLLLAFWSLIGLLLRADSNA